MENPSHHKKIYQQKNRGRFVRRAVKALGATFGFFLFAGTLIFVYYAKDLPRPEKFTEAALAQPTKIYDRTGAILLYEIYGEEKREMTPISDIPEHLQQAVVVTEDANFYHHWGFDWKGIARAVLVNLKFRSRAQGGSTISQQLVRSAFLTREKTFARKIKEMILTLELERRYSKDQILEFYLNQIPWGSNAYGIGAASKTYFGKSPKDLSLYQAAALAAMIQAPGYYSPYGSHKEELLSRAKSLVQRMADQGYIAQAQTIQEDAKDLEFQNPSTPINAPHFVLHVVDELLRRYGENFLRENGLRVRTTLDWSLQQEAEKAVRTHAQKNVQVQAHNAALVALNPQTGEIVAMVGSKDWFGNPYPLGCVPGKNCFFDPKFNVATSLPGRQPGSVFKPFVYAAAFQKGFNDTTIVIDEETNFGVWGGKEYIPQNYDGKFRGPVTLRQALAQSLNIPAVKVLRDLAGIEESMHMAEQMGITTLTKDSSFYGLALVLGGGEVKLLDMVSAYGVFAVDGKKTFPLSILRVESSRGEILEANKKTAMRILSPHIPQLITSILSDNEARAPMFGARSPLYFENAKVAVKTGTSNDFRDAWTIGYTPSIAAGVWVGNNDNSPISKKPGVMVSAPIWRTFMEKALQHSSE